MINGTIGFEVAPWKGKKMTEYTNEELLEYWHKLRLGSGCKTVTKESPMVDFCTLDLQDEILRRMG